MAMKTFKPTSAGRRGLILIDRSELFKGRPIKSLTMGKMEHGGRNNKGRITMRWRGGGHKQRYRMIDFMRQKEGKAVVERIEYDPNRTAFIALLKYQDGELAYILAPQKLAVGDKVEAGANADIKPGNALPLKNIPLGTLVHNVELKPMKGGQLARSAGSFVQLAGRESGYAQIKLMSGELRKVRSDCLATIGTMSNPDWQNVKLGKAGRSRWMGRRGNVRGEVMNPVDHPHGGRTRGGRISMTPWGKPTKGYKTRKNKATDKYIIRSRHDRKGMK